MKIQHHGIELTSHDQIAQAFRSHFQGLLGTRQQPCALHIPTLYDQPLDLHQLDAPFILLEVQHAVNDLAPNKASGADGLPNEFIKQQWPALQPCIMGIFHNFFQQRTDFTPINEARIVLLPKHDTPIAVTDFRPISVINIVPKLISKVPANKIKSHIPDLVGDHQTAFVQGRFIAGNFLTVREALHHVHLSASLAVLLKLDFAKAYDTLDWDFLIHVLRARGFPPKILQWILQLLNTATSRIELNGQLSTPFKHKRGLRQGDPMSPYLFIIAADVFQRMTMAVSAAVPHGLTQKITHAVLNFQYADDTILIASAKGSTL